MQPAAGKSSSGQPPQSSPTVRVPVYVGGPVGVFMHRSEADAPQCVPDASTVSLSLPPRAVYAGVGGFARNSLQVVEQSGARLRHAGTDQLASGHHRPATLFNEGRLLPSTGLF